MQKGFFSKHWGQASHTVLQVKIGISIWDVDLSNFFCLWCGMV